MKKPIAVSLLLAAILLLASMASAAESIPLENWGIETGKIYKDIVIGGMPCWVWIPEGAKVNMPLTIFMHGSGQSIGGRNESMTAVSLPLVLSRGDIPFGSLNTILVAPHRENDPYGNERMIAVIESAAETYGSDKSKIALTGYSWGGVMSYDLVAIRPDLFCSVVITSGRIRPETANELEEMDKELLPPITVVHSQRDTSYNYDELLEALAPLEQSITFITVEGGHGKASVNAYLISDVQKALFLTGEL